VGAILVIAVFYSANLVWFGFVVLASGLGAIVVLQLIGVRSPWAYVPAGVVTWAGAYIAGIHPTFAGVLIGLMTPVKAWFGPEGFIERAEATVAALRGHDAPDERAILSELDRVDTARREAVAPLERIQHALHGWVAYGAMPLFALANAGVSLGEASFSGDSLFVFLGVAGGLVLGKPIGILSFSWLTTRIGIAALPRGVGFREVSVVATVAGIGFTMSIFIAGLAFKHGQSLETAKFAILVGSGVAALLAYGWGRVALPATCDPSAASSAAEAETSTSA
jgi:NhaA family Na+:H+ antiporter